MSKPTPPPADGIRQRPKVGPTRCPYCHDDCLASDPVTCVCGDCLSRHHIACWEEAAGCGSCRSQHRLQAVTRPTPGPPVVSAETAETGEVAEEIQAVPLLLDGARIVVRGEIESGAQVGGQVGDQVDSESGFSLPFLIGNLLVGAFLLWAIWNI